MTAAKAATGISKSAAQAKAVATAKAAAAATAKKEAAVKAKLAADAKAAAAKKRQAAARAALVVKTEAKAVAQEKLIAAKAEEKGEPKAEEEEAKPEAEPAQATNPTDGSADFVPFESKSSAPEPPAKAQKQSKQKQLEHKASALVARPAVAKGELLGQLAHAAANEGDSAVNRFLGEAKKVNSGRWAQLASLSSKVAALKDSLHQQDEAKVFKGHDQ